MNFRDFERAQAIALKNKEEADMECMRCEKCGCQWFEEVTLSRFSSQYGLVLGQSVPRRPGSLGYKFLRCAQCQNLMQPNVEHQARDLAASDYDYLLDVLEGKYKAKEEVKDEKNSGIQSEKL